MVCMSPFGIVENCLPAVSVVIPCRNERDGIEACLQSLLKQESPPGGFEIIVADGMSDDGTRDILTNLSDEISNVHMVDNPRLITPCGMNAGIAMARGRYIAIMGAHNRYAPDYLVQALQVLEFNQADNVGGTMLCEGESWVQRAIAIAHHSPFSVGGARWHRLQYEGPADTVFGGVYRRTVFEKIGFFDEDLIRNQDDEFNLRLKKAGGTIWQSPRIKSWYRPRGSLLALFRQYQQYGYWKVRVIQKHRLPASIRHLVPGGFLLFLGFLLTLAPWSALAMWGFLGTLSIYALFTVGASLVCAARSEWRFFPILPIVFACYHFGYGIGFLGGIWDFVIRRKGPHTTYTQLTRTSKPSS
ncbi:MAG: succinoglycan biosynthesis protein exoa [Nitrospirales bacterium]|nr:MAG: succinoglycan biosynthesis protein exoa [Nitrospirales bacterium]